MTARSLCLCLQDVRPLVRDLLLQHAEELKELRAMVADTRRASSGLGPFSLCAQQRALSLHE